MAHGKLALWVLAGLFVIANSAYLSRVPGLLGDEGSEGENVYELLEREGITVTGERSYIGPAMDYIRVPFVALFGYTTLALRVPILLFSFITFALAAATLRKSFGEFAGLFGLTLFAFSPVYLSYQRLGWAITLFPFFAFLLWWLLQRDWQNKWLWIGLVGGLGLANHLLFFPTLLGVCAGAAVWAVAHKLKTIRQLPEKNYNSKYYNLRATSYKLLLSIIGFWAGFGMQFAVLQLQTDDQGDPSETTQLFADRLGDFWPAVPLYASGSSFAAQYTGVEFSPGTQLGISVALFVLAALAIVLNWKNPAMWALLAGIIVHVPLLLYMVDRFSLRYFVIFALGLWLLAGLGIGSLFGKLKVTGSSLRVVYTLPLVFSLMLIAWIVVALLVPFLQTGGSTKEFSLGNRNDTAAAFVDVQPLARCLEGKGGVYSENVHIWNRLQYLSHSNPGLDIIPENQKNLAQILVEYDSNNTTIQSNICMDVDNFILTSVDKN